MILRIQPLSFGFLTNFRTKANPSLACNGQGKLFGTDVSVFGTDTLCPSITRITSNLGHELFWVVPRVAATHSETVKMNSLQRPLRCCSCSLSYWWLSCPVEAPQLMRSSLLGKRFSMWSMRFRSFASNRLTALSTYARVLVSSNNTLFWWAWMVCIRSISS